MRDKLAVVTAFSEQKFGMGLLKITAADFPARNVCCDSKNGNPAALCVIQSVNQMQVSRPAASGAHAKRSRQMRFGSGCKGCRFFVPNRNPADVISFADCIGDAIQGVSCNAVDPCHSRRNKSLNQKFRYTLLT